MKKLEELLNALERNIPEQELINPEVSKASVGWHIEHSLLTLNLIIEAVQNADPGRYKWVFNCKRTLVFALNKIPRGRVKALRFVQPAIQFDEETLARHVFQSKQKLKVLKGLSGNHFFKHPFLGNLNLKPTIKFLEIHTGHHLHIINDILKTKNGVRSQPFINAYL